MRHEETTETGRGGVALYTQRWLPEQAPAGTVVLAHGYAEHSGRYRDVAATLVEAGWGVFTLDHPGHGRSGGRRAVTEHLQWLLDDLDDVVDAATTGGPAGAKPVLLGHSMGGGIAAAYAVDRHDKLSGLVLSGPTLGMRATVSPIERVGVQILGTLLPAAGTVTLDPGKVSRDPLVVSDYESDPLNYRGRVPARTVREMLRASDLVAARGHEITLPVLIMIGSEDQLAALAGSQDLRAALPGPDVTLTVYDGLYHEIFNEPEKATVLADLVAWLDGHRSATAH